MYDERDAAVTDAARIALAGIETRVGLNQAADLSLDALADCPDLGPKRIARYGEAWLRLLAKA